MRIRRYTLTILLAFLISSPAGAATTEEGRVNRSAAVLEQFLLIPEQSIPPALLSRAYALAVVPQVVKVGFGLGARRGKGVLVIRQDDNTWSNPAFVTLTGGSFGIQFGAQTTDIILVFNNRASVAGIANGHMTLGADASIAAGPVGRHTGAHTDLRFKSGVYSYSRSQGLFAGVALEGASVSMDRLANAAYYDAEEMTPELIFASPGNRAPASAKRFVQVLTAQTSRQSAQSGVAAAETPTQPESTVRTFAVPDPDAAAEQQQRPQK